jgi:molybdate transport system substrate-binding protein
MAKRSGFSLMVLLCGLLGTLSTSAATVRVFAAASLADALKEIATDHERASGDKVVFNFAGSNALARQIEEGAPADVFFSADEAQMNRLETRGLLMVGTRTNLLGNALAIVVAADSGLAVASIHDLTNAAIRRVALADPKAVPAGVYAREHLTRFGLWTAIEPKVVPTENVRAALAAVESGNIEAGIVYRTDAAISKKVKVAHEVPAAEGPVIRYPAAVVKESTEPEAARRFLVHLTSDEAAKVFAKFGFQVRP